jgi:hypothetical protein
MKFDLPCFYFFWGYFYVYIYIYTHTCTVYVLIHIYTIIADYTSISAKLNDISQPHSWTEALSEKRLQQEDALLGISPWYPLGSSHRNEQDVLGCALIQVITDSISSQLFMVV